MKPAVFDPLHPAAVLRLSDTIPLGDKAHFQWALLKFSDGVVSPLELALIGGIRRHPEPLQSPTFGHGVDWRTSIITISTDVARISYGRIPTTVKAASFDTNGHFLLCGNPLTESLLTQPEPILTYDVDSNSYVSTQEKLHSL
jgi:hypothetical protein